MISLSTGEVLAFQEGRPTNANHLSFKNLPIAFQSRRPIFESILGTMMD